MNGKSNCLDKCLCYASPEERALLTGVAAPVATKEAAPVATKEAAPVVVGLVGTINIGTPKVTREAQI